MRQAQLLEDAALTKQLLEDGDTGFGMLKAARGNLPLVAMDVRAKLTGLIADIAVSQVFRNSLAAPLEATYIFPLPDRAAVTSFRMKVGDRVVEGELKERGQARQDYERAIEEGHRAVIAEEERSGTFSLRVGNIPPQEEVSIELTLLGPVTVSDGEATFRFPLVVAPRYVSGVPADGAPVGSGWGLDTNEVPDASRVTPPVLLRGFPNPVHLSLEVEIDPAGLGPTNPDWTAMIWTSLRSAISDQGPPWTVRLEPGERLNRDFILRFPVASDGIQTTLTYTPAIPYKSGVVAVTIVPPMIPPEHRPAPRDVVFVLDRSGSMDGWKIVAARRAVGRMIDSLLDQDQFSVLAFDDKIECPNHASAGLIKASDRHRWRAMEWLGNINARGGTELGPALQQAVGLLATSDSGRQRIVVLITDGQVAGEDAVLNGLQKLAGPHMPRIHTLGVDQAVNEGFLQRLAGLGKGVCNLVESEDRLDQAMDHIHRTIGTPALTQFHLEPIGFEWIDHSLAPTHIPDLYADRPVTIYGRFTGESSALRLRVCGQDALGKPWQREVVGQRGPTEALIGLWGRARIRDMEDKYFSGGASNPTALAEQIIAISLASHVLSRFTAYVAVDHSEVTNEGGQQRQITQPVEMPEGWNRHQRAEIMRCLISASYPPARSDISHCMNACDVGLPLDGTYSSPSDGSFPNHECMREPICGSMEEVSCDSIPPRQPADIVSDLRKTLAILQNFSSLETSFLARSVVRLVELLEELARVLRPRHDELTKAIATLVERGRNRVAATHQIKSDAGVDDRLSKFLADVDQTITETWPESTIASILGNDRLPQGHD